MPNITQSFIVKNDKINYVPLFTKIEKNKIWQQIKETHMIIKN